MSEAVPLPPHGEYIRQVRESCKAIRHKANITVSLNLTLLQRIASGHLRVSQQSNRFLLGLKAYHRPTTISILPFIDRAFL